MNRLALLVLISGLVSLASPRAAETQPFRGAPRSASQLKNPYTRKDRAAASEGANLFAVTCAGCHGAGAQGSGNVPSLVRGPLQSAKDGEIFWFITQGSPQNGMPPCTLPEGDRWKIITFLKALPSSPELAVTPPQAPTQDLGGLPPPQPPFTDFRFEKPGQVHKILPTDLPAPSTNVSNGPRVVPRPEGAWPKVPPGFKVGLYASSLESPRLLRTAPNGDVFLAESNAGKILVFQGLTSDGRPARTKTYVTGLNKPYGIAFYPPGKDPRWIYIGNTDAVLRIPYRAGDVHASAKPQKIADLPSSLWGHWTRDLQFSLDGKRLFVAVGSASNVSDPDTTPGEKERADILVMDPHDGSGRKVYAYGIRNAGGGLAMNPVTADLWASVNERDGLGDNLVPDYITHVPEGGFFGWPWWYIGGHQDPHHRGKHPELRSKLLEPDVLIQPHNASFQLTFYDGKQFPAEYRGDLFSSQHGSWNRSVRTGYEVIRVPFHGKNKPIGEYEDFMTGFVVDNSSVWGRPVGITVISDGSLLVSDDESNSIWRISYDRAPK